MTGCCPGPAPVAAATGSSRSLTTASGVAIIATVVLVGVFLLWRAVPSIMSDQVNFLTSREWNVQNPDDLRFGILDLLDHRSQLDHGHGPGCPRRGGDRTVHHAVRPRRMAQPVAYLVDLLAAVPSIIFGLWGHPGPGPPSSRSATGCRAPSVGSRCSHPA